jgi:hypothetical protein
MPDTPKHIPKEELRPGWYRGRCRNAPVAYWNGEVFLYIRHKFGSYFIEEIQCPEDEHLYDVFYAQERIEF